VTHSAAPEDRATVFATAVYGADYARFLAPHLLCVSEAHPEARICVLWRDVPEREIEPLRRAFPQAEFRELDEPIEGDLHQRIGRKLRAWTALCELHPADRIVLLDCDALVARPIHRFFDDDADVVFTWKDEPFVLNTGVMIFRSGETAVPFFREWTQRCEAIVADPPALRRACAQSGAADQHSLREMIGFANYDGRFDRDIAGRKTALRGVPCRLLNETNSVPISDDTHVIHYKAGWRPILFEGARERPGRPAELCGPMLDFFRNATARAERHVARAAVASACSAAAERFGGAIAPYEERGILLSEMLAVCGVCDALDVDLVIESGRCRGQSTLVLARYFAGSKTRIVSFELERDANAAFAEERLAPHPEVDLRFGDSLARIPELLRGVEARRVAVLLDGPVAGFVHDTRRETPQRDQVEAHLPRSFFTDDEAYVALHESFDELCLPAADAEITLHTWRPYKKGEDAIPSYGPTLAVVLPSLHATPLPRPAPAARGSWLRRAWRAARRLLGSIERRLLG
jgi:hypothetical protein